ncbi:MAG: nuclear transport factor 2 family protein [Actinomycetota bacterium]|nr:nuclear transport factor 2 family protein [Actinomycetota bacterium]MDQ2956312.1 nuclear transport factor 2 family protein [Actinomycetota bacterium]
MPNDNPVAADEEAIASIVRTFFAAFTSGPDSASRLDELRAVFLPEAVIVRTGGGEPAVYDVESFIAPRQALLSGGTLVDFSEWEVRGHTNIFGDIAQHFGSYAKAGVQDGTPFNARGMKTMQFIRTAAGWRISAAAWDDERDGLELEPAYAP